MVSQDGGVPVLSQSWDGHASDTQIVQERAHALLATLQGSPSPRSVGAAATLYPEEHATNLAHLGFSTRLPGTRKLVAQGSTPARQWDTWQGRDATPRSQRLALCHYGMAQRGLVVWPQASLERAEARVKHACPREAEAVKKQRFHLHAQRFEPPSQAPQAWSALAHHWRYHQVPSSALIDPKRSAKKGRPMADTPIKASEWQRQAQVRPETERREEAKHHKACVVLGTNIAAEQRSDAEVITSDKGQAQVGGRVPISQGPAVFCLVVVCEKALPHAGIVDGDDPGATGLFSSATSSAPGVSPSKRDDPASTEPTDQSSAPEVGVASVGRD